MTIVTRDSITEALASNSLQHIANVVGESLVILLNNTNNDKGGFTTADTFSGTMAALHYQQHNRLEEWQVGFWMVKNNRGVPRLAKYHKQLNAAAEKNPKNYPR